MSSITLSGAGKKPAPMNLVELKKSEWVGNGEKH